MAKYAGGSDTMCYKLGDKFGLMTLRRDGMYALVEFEVALFTLGGKQIGLKDPEGDISFIPFTHIDRTLEQPTKYPLYAVDKEA